jgi:TPR repeat protein
VAVDYYRRAVDAGHKAAHVNLGQCYSESIRVAVDKAAAQSTTVAPGTSPP